MTKPTPRATRKQPSNAFGIVLFAAMVGAVATVALLVMGGESWGLLSAASVGLLIASVAAVVLAVLMRAPLPPPGRSASAFERSGDHPVREPHAEGHGAAAGRGGRAPGDDPGTTAATRFFDSVPDAGGVGVPATPEARSPGEAAERPLPGAGNLGASPEREMARTPGDDHGGSNLLGARGRAGNGEASDADGPAAREGRRAEPVDVAAPAREAAGAPDAARGAPHDTVRVADSVGRRPDLMAAPDGEADDLKAIRGVGPKIEGMLHRMGVWHYRQIASWGPDEVAWVDEHLEGFNGRVERDDWVGQARALREGRAPEPRAGAQPGPDV